MWRFSDQSNEAHKFTTLNSRVYRQVGEGWSVGDGERRTRRRDERAMISSLDKVLKIGGRAFTVIKELRWSFWCTRRLR